MLSANLCSPLKGDPCLSIASAAAVADCLLCGCTPSTAVVGPAVLSGDVRAPAGAWNKGGFAAATVLPVLVLFKSAPALAQEKVGATCTVLA